MVAGAGGVCRGWATTRPKRLDDRGDAGVVGAGHRHQHRAGGVQDPDDLQVLPGPGLVGIGVGVAGGQPPASLPGDGVLAHGGELGAAADHVLVDELAQVGLAPAGPAEELRVLRAEHDQGADRLGDERAGPRDGAGDVQRELLGQGGVPGLDVKARP